MGPVSVSTVAFDGYPLPVALATIAAAGARSVEIAYIEGYVAFDETAFADAAAADLASAMAAEGLGSIAVSAHIDMGLPGAEAKLRRRLGFARRLGASILITNTTTRDREPELRRALDAILPVCADLGIVLALENPGQGRDLVIGDAAEGVALVAPYRSPWLRLNYDVGNAVTASDERVRPEDDLGTALPFMAHVHAKDLVSDERGWRFCPIGQGSIDYPAVAAALARGPAGLPVCLEIPLRLSRPGRGDPVRSGEPPPLDAVARAIRESLRFWAATAEALRQA